MITMSPQNHNHVNLSLAHGRNVRAHREQLECALKNRERFTAANLTGEPASGTLSPWSTGRMDPGEEYTTLTHTDQLEYVVRSYQTPIAWFITGQGWTVTDQRYSRTTGRHQSILRMALPS